jgi:hypothetical protein
LGHAEEYGGGFTVLNTLVSFINTNFISIWD